MKALRHIIKTIPILLVCTCTFNLAHSQSLPKALGGNLRLVLPTTIYAVAGVETNIYFDNVVLTPHAADYVFTVRCAKGGLFSERWAYTPAPDESGSFPLILDVSNGENQLVARAASTLEVVPAGSGAGRAVTLLAVGDSLTQASVYTQRLLDLAAGANGPSLALIGSRGPGNGPAHGANRHEGYAGWTAEAFATLHGPLARSGNFREPGAGSPFFYEASTPHLDFARYCAQFNKAKPPDFVTFALGTNDIFLADDTSIDQVIDRTFGYLDSLVAMVHKFDRSTRIGILLVIPPSKSQDGFEHYKGRLWQTRWQYRRNQHRMLERMIAHFGGKQAEDIYLVPAYLGLDADHNFPRRFSPSHSQACSEEARVEDGIHPTADGYRQIGDVIYAWMKSLLAFSDR